MFHLQICCNDAEFFFADNHVSLPGVDASKAYVNTKNIQYQDDAEEFLYKELLSNYGDILVSCGTSVHVPKYIHFVVFSANLRLN